MFEYKPCDGGKCSGRVLLGLAMPGPVLEQVHDVTASVVLIPSADIAARLAEKLPE